MIGDPTVIAMFEQVVMARAEDLFMHLPVVTPRLPQQPRCHNRPAPGEGCGVAPSPEAQRRPQRPITLATQEWETE